MKKIMIMLLWMVSMNVFAGAPEYCDYNDCEGGAEDSGSGSDSSGNIILVIIGLLMIYAVGKAVWKLVSGQDDSDCFGVMIIWYVHMMVGSVIGVTTLWKYLSGKTFNNHMPIEFIYVGAACSIYLLFTKEKNLRMWSTYILMGFNFAAALSFLN
jgi:hypothetical protein